jgi:hypothetical protein
MKGSHLRNCHTTWNAEEIDIWNAEEIDISVFQSATFVGQTQTRF